MVFRDAVPTLELQSFKVSPLLREACIAYIMLYEWESLG